MLIVIPIESSNFVIVIFFPSISNVLLSGLFFTMLNSSSPLLGKIHLNILFNFSSNEVPFFLNKILQSPLSNIFTAAYSGLSF